MRSKRGSTEWEYGFPLMVKFMVLCMGATVFYHNTSLGGGAGNGVERGMPGFRQAQQSDYSPGTSEDIDAWGFVLCVSLSRHLFDAATNQPRNCRMRARLSSQSSPRPTSRRKVTFFRVARHPTGALNGAAEKSVNAGRLLVTERKLS